MATCDVYYIDPAYRNNGAGTQMFQEIERMLKRSGVDSWIVQDKVDHPNETFFNSLGFTMIERTYEKVI